jgi:hypothetical protein
MKIHATVVELLCLDKEGFLSTATVTCRMVVPAFLYAADLSL